MTVHATALTRAGWRGEAAAWQALVQSQRLLERAVNSALRRYPEYRDRREELTQAVLVERAERVMADRGLATAEPPRDPEAWLVTVFRNAASSRLRAWRRRDHRRVELELDRVADEAEGVDPEDVARALCALDALPPRYALAWVLRHAPECLERDLVNRACAAERRGHRASAGGLARGPEETWRLLQRWLERHARRPGAHVARRELAWVLRCDEDGEPEAWCARRPAAMRRALDTVGTWERRARARLRQAR